jgi:cysteinyl-tRNA synthetase
LITGVEKHKGENIDFDFEKFNSLFAQAMDDDFNTPKATAVIFDFVKEVNKLLTENENIEPGFYKEALEFLRITADEVLGIVDLSEIEKENNVSDDAWILEQIEFRLKAKAEKNWQLADEIRNYLAEKGIILEDTKDGTTYKKKTN